MTLDEMKLAVCEKLPEVVWVYPSTPAKLFWRNGQPINWPTEGLQVCHEATNKTGWSINIDRVDDEWSVMLYAQNDSKREIIEVMNKDLLTAWLESLCRVWWPERFN